jgi:tetratricopeptide (TPR) repeat protein
MDALLAALQRDPRAKFSRWTRVGLALAGVALLLVGLRAQQRSQVRACRLAAEQLGGTWNGAVKNEIRAAFTTTRNARYGADTYERLAGMLDRYASAWVAMRTEACEATQVRGEQSAQLMDLRMHCLDRRASELSAMLTVLVQASEPSVVEHALDAASGLDDVGTCADRASLIAAVPPPSDPRVRQRVAKLRARLDEAQALERAGRRIAGLERASGAREEARDIGYAPLEAEAALLVALLQKHVTDAATAEASLREAVQLAAKAHDDVREAAAWTELVDLVGHVTSRPADGLALRSAAEAAVLRAGDTPALRAKLLMSTSEVLQQAGRSVEALDDVEHAVALWEQTAGPDAVETARALAAKARVLGAFERWADVEQTARRAVAIYERQLGPEHPEVGRSLETIGFALTALGRNAEAETIYERALAIAERSSGPMAPETRKIYLSRGILSMKDGRWPDALAHLERALAIGDEYVGPASSFSAAALINLTEVLHRLDRHGEERAACERAFDVLVNRHAVGPDHPIIPWAWDCMGFVSLDQRRNEEAISRFRRAVELFERISPGKADDAHGLVHLGEAYLIGGQAREALPLLTRATAILETQEVAAADRGDGHFALARALWQTGTDRDRALTAAARAIDDYAAAGPGRNEDVARVTKWLAGRRR